MLRRQDGFRLFLTTATSISTPTRWKAPMNRRNAFFAGTMKGAAIGPGLPACHTLVKWDGLAWIRFTGVVSWRDFISRPALYGSVAGGEGVQAITNDLAFGGVFTGCDLSLEHFGHAYFITPLLHYLYSLNWPLP